MSRRVACWCGIVSVVLGLPSVSLGQNQKNCCKPCGSSTSGSAPGMPGMPKFNTPGTPSLQIPTGPWGFNTPMTNRRGFQPNVPLGPQQNFQQQLAIQRNLRFQQGLMQQVQQQWMLQDQVKRQLLQFAIEAPTENLQRELKNSNAFVRWAASVELNRRWRLDKSHSEAAKAAATKAARTPTVPARLRSATPAVVTPVSQALALQLNVPETTGDRLEFQRSIPTR